MGWPLTPLTTYVSSTTPAIRASDLNSFQSAINGLYAGSSSIVGLELDGTGGQSVTPVAGTLRVDGTGIAGTNTTPTPTPQIGRLYRELMPVQYARFNYSGGSSGSFTLYQGYNVQTLTHSSTGTFSAQFVTTPPSWSGVGVCVASIVNTTNGSTYMLVADTDIAHSIIKVLSGSSSPVDPTSNMTISFITFGI
jgi:hypothetical protein